MNKHYDENTKQERCWHCNGSGIVPGHAGEYTIDECNACKNGIMTVDTSRSITIKFANDAVALNFAKWLCDIGEQDYWNSMENVERRENGPITATSFWYHGTNDGDGFMKDWTIRTKCGRLDGK